MKNSAKIAFIAVLIGALGFGGLRRVYAQQCDRHYAPAHRSNISVAQSSNQNGEVNDATEAPENAKSLLKTTYSAILTYNK